MYIQLIAQPDSAMHQPDQSLWINARLATCDAANPAPYGALEGHALWLKDGRIHAVLPQAQALQAFGQAGSVHDAQGRWLTPGLVDCHTPPGVRRQSRCGMGKAPHRRAVPADSSRRRRHHFHCARHPQPGRRRAGAGQLAAPESADEGRRHPPSRSSPATA